MILVFDFLKNNKIIFDCNNYTLKIKDTIIYLNNADIEQEFKINQLIPTHNNSYTLQVNVEINENIHPKYLKA